MSIDKTTVRAMTFSHECAARSLHLDFVVRSILHTSAAARRDLFSIYLDAHVLSGIQVERGAYEMGLES